VGVFGFPNPVNETSARLVAAGVVVETALFLVFREGWLLVPLVFGFAARVLAGPRFSPLARFVTQVVTPRLRIEHRFAPGPPKRFAQAMGVAFSGGAAIAWLAGAPVVTYVLLGLLTVAATLEAVFAICLGCIVFGALMQVGVIPESVCAECRDVRSRLAARSSVPAKT
jgi:Domain of unknown function (DUF4395)